MEVWELDRFDATALVGAAGGEVTTIAWTDDQLLRVGYLIELEKALLDLNPKIGVARWIAAPKPGPFFDDHSPLQMLTGSTREIAELVHQVRKWSVGRA